MVTAITPAALAVTVCYVVQAERFTLVCKVKDALGDAVPPKLI